MLPKIGGKKFDCPLIFPSREVKELVRTVFQLPDDLLIEDYLNIEAYLLKADGSKYLVEI
ncbi:MAG: hypothetical protein NT166_21190 [Candidatus Aminicenantes bacterium]|nr:hypothetical protein [Candidatus Aminicenantes bacterium]